MAVYTHLTPEALEGFLAGFSLGRVRRFHGIQEGIENSNFYVETEAGRYILTLFERRVREAELPFFLDLMHWLADRGFPCPLPQADREGRYIRQLAGKPAAVVSFLEGRPEHDPDPACCREGGEGLARLHLAGAGFPGRRENDLGAAAWAGMFAGREAQADALRPGLALEIGADLAALEQRWPWTLPQGVIHADLFPDNVFFLDQRFAGAIDFYFACTDALAYDIAVMLNAWCFGPDGRFEPERARALVDGYTQLRPLSAAERAALPVLAQGAAMRFFLTRLIDWSSTPEGALVKPKDPREYEGKLAFHRRAAGDPQAYGLHA
jgi:homoserine kinase type II